MPRGVMHSWADGKGGQRMETVDDETVAATKEFIKKAVASGKPFFTGWNGTRIHFRTHVKKNTGASKADPRHEFIYVNDDGDIVAVRSDDWKIVYTENRGQAFGVWREPFTELRVQLVFNLRRDPWERAQHNANIYEDRALDRVFMIQAGCNVAT